MSLIVQIEDFTGDNAIASDVYTTDELQLAIDEYETTIIYELLGIELAVLFIADLVDFEPVDPDYLAFFNSFYKEIENELVISKGMRSMLVMFIYFYFVRKQSQNNTIGGLTQSENSISKMSAMNYSSLVLKENDAVKTYRAIQTFIESEKSTTYPLFKGIIKEFAPWA